MAAPRGLIDIQIVGDSRSVDAMLRRVELKTSPAGISTWLDTRVDPWLRERTRLRFQNEGDDVVGNWAPLKPYTQGIRASQGYGGAHPINVRTGEMERYLVSGPHQITPTPGGAILELPDPSGARGDLVDKLRTAQQGSQYPATVPRPVLGMNDRDLEFVLVSLAEMIQR